MSVIEGDAGPACFGTPSEISVTRGLAEFHARRPVQITASAENILVLPVDGLDAERLAAFRQLCAPAAVSLAVTAQRAQALGIDAEHSVTLRLDSRVDSKRLLALASDATATYTGPVDKA